VELAVEERRHLAGEADHRQQIDAVDRRRHVEHVVADRQHVEERRAGVRPLGQDHDPGVVLAETDLVLGQDHPAGGLTAQLALVERHVEDRQVRARKRDRDRRARLEVPCAAHDLTRVPLPHVDLADAEAIGVRVCAHLEHAADEEAVEVPVRVCHADVEDVWHLERRDREPARDLLHRSVDGDVLAEPGHRGAHQNCSTSRGSLRQSSRRSGIPCRSTAMRSRPQPKAKPV
jgi:hypothetical protein